MLRHERFDSTDTSSVRMIAMGGGPSTAALVREARARFGVPVVVRYTCTEAGVGVGTAADDPPEDAEESVGRARKGVELTIRSDDDDRAGSGRARPRMSAVAGGHARLLARPRGDRGGVHRRRCRADGGSRFRRRARPAAPVGALQGDVRARRLQRVPARGRERARRSSRRRPCGGDPASRPGHGRDRCGRRRGAPRRGGRPRWRCCATTPGDGWPPTSFPRRSSSPTSCRGPPWRRSTGPPSARSVASAPVAYTSAPAMSSSSGVEGSRTVARMASAISLHCSTS